MSKEYNPHIIAVWTSSTIVFVKEFPFKEDAEEKYRELLEVHTQKIVMAKVVKTHGEG